MNKSLQKLNEKLTEVMTTLQENTGKTEQLNNEVTHLKKDVQEKFNDMKRKVDDIQTLKPGVMDPKAIVPDEDMSSLVLELKNCLKSYRNIAKDNSEIREKIYKVYGKNFFDR